LIVINIFGVPGSGKSTMASYIFYKLKSNKINCELVTEVAKDAVWDRNNKALTNQMYITGNQCYRIERLKDEVDVVITDSPLMLQPIYYRLNGLPEPDMFEIILYKMFEQYQNINLILPMPDGYDTNGRVHTEQQLANIFDKMLDILDKYEIQTIPIDHNTDSVDELLNKIIKIMKK